MAIETVAVAGGSGLVGSTLVDQLNEQGYRTVNLDVQPLGRGDTATNRAGTEVRTADEFRRTDLLDPGQVHGSLAVADADAVVHLGTVTSSTTTPWQVCYENNVMTSYNLLDAATNLDVQSVTLASSICALGLHFAGPPAEIDYLPVDEDHRTTPNEPYGLAKRVVEVTGEGFSRLDGAPWSVSAVRFAGVQSDGDLRRLYLEPDRSLSALTAVHEPGDNHLFSYIHVEDAATILRRAVEADFEGYEAFWASAPDTTADVPTADLVETFFPDTRTHRDFEGYETLLDLTKARDVLGWEPVRSYRDLE